MKNVFFDSISFSFFFFTFANFCCKLPMPLMRKEIEFRTKKNYMFIATETKGYGKLESFYRVI